MATDTERRDVAENLRYLADYPGAPVRYAEQFRDELSAVVLPDGFTHDYSELLQRLADLIELSEPKVKCVADVNVDGERLEKLAHDAALELTGIDRDALLALADEIWENADISRELHGEMLKEKRLDMALTFHEYAFELREYADRIREALGVEK